jgi:predicted Kef-type K+ transport protein
MKIVQSEHVWVALVGMIRKNSSVSSSAKEVTWRLILEDLAAVVIFIAVMIAGKPFSVAKTHTEHSVSIWARTQNKDSLGC